MLTYIVAFLLAMIVSAAATPFITKVAHKKGWLDEPTEARKVHTRAVPRLGGIAVVLAFFTPILGLAIYTNRISGLLYADARLVMGFFGGALAIVGLGIFDDLKGASPKLKLLVQTGVAAFLWYLGFRIELLGNPLGTAFELGLLSLPLTVLWMVGVINALNLIDGLDGLATGVSIFASVVLFGVAFVDNAVLLCLITAALAGSLLGFLFFNFNPAKIFLGDSGSMFLGFILSTVSIWTQRKGATAVALLIPVLALGLPLLDTTLSFVRRVGNGRNPFKADREHMHHRLMALGLSHRNTVLTMYTASIIFGLGALALLDNDTTHRAIALSTVAVVALMLVRKVGVFKAPGAPKQPAVVTITRDELRMVARGIRGSMTSDEAWQSLCRAFAKLGCVAARLTWSTEYLFGDDRRDTVFFWRRHSSEDWPLEKAELEPGALILSVEEQEQVYGELVILLEKGHDAKFDAELLLCGEFLKEALIDFRAGQIEEQAEVVRLADARNRTAGI